MSWSFWDLLMDYHGWTVESPRHWDQPRQHNNRRCTSSHRCPAKFVVDKKASVAKPKRAKPNRTWFGHWKRKRQVDSKSEIQHHPSSSWPRWLLQVAFPFCREIHGHYPQVAPYIASPFIWYLVAVPPTFCEGKWASKMDSQQPLQVLGEVIFSLLRSTHPQSFWAGNSHLGYQQPRNFRKGRNF